MTGHLLGGAGSWRLVSLYSRFETKPHRPRSISLHPDVDYGLDFIVGAARTLSIESAMTNSFGFGRDKCVPCLSKTGSTASTGPEQPVVIRISPQSTRA